MKRTLKFSRETLTELAPDQLTAVQAGAPPTLNPGCVAFSDLFHCPTHGTCPPPP